MLEEKRVEKEVDGGGGGCGKERVWRAEKGGRVQWQGGV